MRLPDACSPSHWGRYRIRFDASAFKCCVGADTSQPYEMRLGSLAQAAIQDYITVYRPTLLDGQDSDRVFVSSRPIDKSRPWSGLNSSVVRFTRDYFGNALGPHSFRHIVATVYLKQHPEGFLTVSQILHDRLDTVLATYAHLQVGTGFDTFNEWMERESK